MTRSRLSSTRTWIPLLQRSLSTVYAATTPCLTTRSHAENYDNIMTPIIITSVLSFGLPTCTGILMSYGDNKESFNELEELFME